MNSIEYIRSDDAWKIFCHNYLRRKGFCIACEEKGKSSVATMVYQPTPDQDKLKRKYSEYNLQPLCIECFYSKRVTQRIKIVLRKVGLYCALVAAVVLLLTIFF